MIIIEEKKSNKLPNITSLFVKVPFNKIIGIAPYSDGIEVHKDGANQNRMAMQGFDPWFLMNVLAQINNI